MKIGFQTSKHNNLSLSEESAYTKGKADLFDIFFDDYTVSDISEKDIKEIINLKKSGISVTTHLPIADYFEISDSYIQYIDFINRISPKTATIHFDRLSYEVIEYFISRIKSDTLLSIENTIPDYNKKYGTDYYSFMKEVSQKFNISATIDVGHAMVNKTEPLYLLEELNRLNIKISTVHLHDNDGIKDTHLPPGKGIIKFKDFFNSLKKLNIEPLMIIEHWNDNAEALNYYRSMISF